MESEDMLARESVCGKLEGKGYGLHVLEEERGILAGVSEGL